MRYWDASALVPLVLAEAETDPMRGLARMLIHATPVMLVPRVVA